MSIYKEGWTRDKVMQVIRKENLGEPSLTNGVCRYLADDGNKCLVGCFILDDKYQEDFEGLSLDNLLREYTDLDDFFPVDKYYMDRLQTYHDVYLDSETIGEDFFNSIEQKLIEFEQRYV